MVDTVRTMMCSLMIHGGAAAPLPPRITFR
jgi:hypothetical protein